MSLEPAPVKDVVEPAKRILSRVRVTVAKERAGMRVEWDELYANWRYRCQLLYAPIVEDLGAIELEVGYPGWDWRGNEYIDWWPNESLDRRVAGVKRDGVQSIYRWEKSKAGTRTTAELLWE